MALVDNDSRRPGKTPRRSRARRSASERPARSSGVALPTDLDATSPSDRRLSRLIKILHEQNSVDTALSAIAADPRARTLIEAADGGSDLLAEALSAVDVADGVG